MWSILLGHALGANEGPVLDESERNHIIFFLQRSAVHRHCERLKGGISSRITRTCDSCRGTNEPVYCCLSGILLLVEIDLFCFNPNIILVVFYFPMLHIRFLTVFFFFFLELTRCRRNWAQFCQSSCRVSFQNSTGNRSSLHQRQSLHSSLPS